MATIDKQSLALEYHESSKVFSGLQLSFTSNTEYKIYPNTKATQMTKNNLGTLTSGDDNFIKALLLRKSTRSFAPRGVGFDSLSKLLTLSCGMQNARDNEPWARTYASAGARFPIETYAVILSSDEMELGIYHHNIPDNTLELVKAGDYSEEVNSFYSNQIGQVITKFPCLILFSVILDRTMQMYGERGYRFAMLDAGHMSQNLYLVASYLKLGIVALGGGVESDSKLDEMLRILPNEESVFFGFAVGHPAECNVESTDA